MNHGLGLAQQLKGAACARLYRLGNRRGTDDPKDLRERTMRMRVFVVMVLMRLLPLFLEVRMRMIPVTMGMRVRVFVLMMRIFVRVLLMMPVQLRTLTPDP